MEILQNPRGIAYSYTYQVEKEYDLWIPSVTLDDDGLAIAVTTGGCSVNAVSPIYTLKVTCCNASHFEPESFATNLTCCGYNCERQFRRSDNSTFTAYCQYDATWYAAECDWNIHQPGDGVKNYRRAIGAPAVFGLHVYGEMLLNADTVVWKANNTDLSVQRYSSNDRSFTEELLNPRAHASSTQGGYNYTMEIPSVTSVDDGLQISLTSSGCAINYSSPVIILQVECCNVSHFEPESLATNSTCCGYNCERQFKRSDNSTFNARCLNDATWYAPECYWHIRRPGDGGTEYRRAIGAPAVFELSVSNEIMMNADTVVWKSNHTDLSVQRYSSDEGSFTEQLLNPRAHANSSYGYYRMEIPSVASVDDGLQISVTSSGCAMNYASPVITLQVECCNSSSFEPDAYANETTCCRYNCTRKFRRQDNSTFYAVCKDDTTWWIKPECHWSLGYNAFGTMDTEFTVAAGGHVYLSLDVRGEITANDYTVTWKANETDLSVQHYSSSRGIFMEILQNSRGMAYSYTNQVGSRYGLWIPSVTLDDDGLAIAVTTGGCSLNAVSPVYTIKVTCCNVSHFEPESFATNLTCCGYDCERRFTRSDNSTFNARCLEDATWYKPECYWNIQQPQDGGREYRRAIGAPAVFEVDVYDEIMMNADTVVWKANHTDLSVQRYSSYDRNFTEELLNPRAHASSNYEYYGYGYYGMEIPSVTSVDDGLRISVTSSGCAKNYASPVITLQVECCDSSYFEPDAYANETTCCKYHCTREFRRQDSSTFNAVCQDDTTWWIKPGRRINCNFESTSDICFTQIKNDDFDWTRNSAETSSYNTGPSVDHTFGTSEGFYMYIEATGTFHGQIARLQFGPYPASSGGNCYGFWYHMYGETTGTLNVYQVVNGMETLLWSKSGQRGDIWWSASLDITVSTQFYIIMEGIAGSDFRSDIAIDDVSFIDDACPTAVLMDTTTTTTTTATTATTPPPTTTDSTNGKYPEHATTTNSSPGTTDSATGTDQVPEHGTTATSSPEATDWDDVTENYQEDQTAGSGATDYGR